MPDHESDVDRLRRWSDAVAEIIRLVNSDNQTGLFDVIAARTAEFTGNDFCAVQWCDPRGQTLRIVGSYAEPRVRRARQQ